MRTRRPPLTTVFPLVSSLLTLLVSGALAVIMSSKASVDDLGGGGVDVCLKGGGPVLPCLNAGALEFLEEANQRGGVEVVDGLELVQDDNQAPRAIVPLDHDPNDIRSLWDASAMFLERRSLRWDLGLLYPGLVLRVGPTLNGQGVLEFLLDHRKVDDRSIGTGRLIVKRTLLPILLAVKLNVATLVPLVFGLLFILIKKALFISKAALLISGLLGYNHLQQGHGLGGFGLGGSHGGLGGLGGLGGSGGLSNYGNSYNHHVVNPLEDTLFKAQQKYRQDVPFTTRDFSWTERDKKKSTS